MRSKAERTPLQWYEEAVRAYEEGHQGCPSCGTQHCVFRSQWGQRFEYYCSACDFSTCYDGQTGQYVAVIGDGRQLAEGLFSDDGFEERVAG
jgi:uncharacterized protein YdiU (UPF0061 family)